MPDSYGCNGIDASQCIGDTVALTYPSGINGLNSPVRFPGGPVFDHDFDHINYDVTEFDQRAGTPGLHTVRPMVNAEPRDPLLPLDLFNRFIRDTFRRDSERVPPGLQIVYADAERTVACDGC